MSVRTWPVVRRAFEIWNDHNAMQLAAAIAFYAMLSMAPLLVVALRILSLKYGNNAEDEIGRQVDTFIGSDQAATPGGAIRQTLHMVAHTRHGFVASLISFGIAMVSGSTLFANLQNALNFMWDVKTKKGFGLRNLLRNRLAAGAMVLFAAILLLSSFAITAAFSVIVHRLGAWMSGFSYVADTIASFVVAYLMFAVVFKVLPDVKVAWADVWFGSSITALLFLAGKFGLTVYFKLAAVEDPYGAAGSLAALLIWVYYSAALMFLGVAFTRAHAESLGRRIIPKPYAVQLKIQED